MTILQFILACNSLGALGPTTDARIAHFASSEDATIAYYLIKEAYPEAFIKHYENIVAFPPNEGLQSLQK